MEGEDREGERKGAGAPAPGGTPGAFLFGVKGQQWHSMTMDMMQRRASYEAVTLNFDIDRQGCIP